FHLTANPNKKEGTRLSLVSVPASDVYPIWDEEMPGRMIGCDLMIPWEEENDDRPQDGPKAIIRILKYRLEESENGTRRVSREEGLYEFKRDYYGKSTFRKRKDI